jgi:hypothetical protein
MGAGATLVAEAAAPHHAAYPWHAMPAFDLAYGFLGCALIVIVSKALGRAALQRPERYYGDGE